jgi:hypothetical protein
MANIDSVMADITFLMANIESLMATIERPMANIASAMANIRSQQPRHRQAAFMSALDRITDSSLTFRHVRFVPGADIVQPRRRRPVG